ncbi:glycine-rich cell wall structural protein 2-like [Salvia divinorum]|uniref:Glycine-rich cell wall structural protein 2-like n=1 Tax=Salvia divinorum TaxID=28513 RepID=A0ABD1FML1_SALDI
MRTTILHVTITLLVLASMNCWAHRFGGEGGRRRIMGSSETPTGGSGEAHAPSWDYSWGWGSSPTSGWGYGSGSGKSPNGFARGSGWCSREWQR